MLTLNRNDVLMKYVDTIFVPRVIPFKKYTGSLKIEPIAEKTVRFQVPITPSETKIVKNQIMSCKKENTFTERSLYIRESRYKYRKIY